MYYALHWAIIQSIAHSHQFSVLRYCICEFNMLRSGADAAAGCQGGGAAAGREDGHSHAQAALGAIRGGGPAPVLHVLGRRHLLHPDQVSCADDYILHKKVTSAFEFRR